MDLSNLSELIESRDYGALGILTNALKLLTPRQEKVLRLSYGLGCARGHSVAEIAGEFDVSKNRIHGFRRQALERLRQFAISPESLQLAVELEESVRQRPVILASPLDSQQIETCSAVQRLVQESNITQSQLLALSPREFEEFIAEIWDQLGYAVELTARTRDGGRDVVAIKKAESAVRFIIECKRYDESNKVGVSFVRALYGVKFHEGATKAFLATTSTFTRGARDFWVDHQWEIELKDFEGLLEWTKRVHAFQKSSDSSLWLPS